MDMSVGYAVPVSVLGKSIRARRKPLMNQTVFGERMGITQSSVSQWERGESTPDAKQLVKIAAVLRCSVEDLVVGVDDDYDRLRRTRPVTTGSEDRTLARKGGSDVPASDAAAARIRKLDQDYRQALTATKDVARRLVEALAAHGESISVDDAGTGTTVPGARGRSARPRK